MIRLEKEPLYAISHTGPEQTWTPCDPPVGVKQRIDSGLSERRESLWVVAKGRYSHFVYRRQFVREGTSSDNYARYYQWYRLENSPR